MFSLKGPGAGEHMTLRSQGSGAFKRKTTDVKSVVFRCFMSFGL